MGNEHCAAARSNTWVSGRSRSLPGDIRVRRAEFTSATAATLVICDVMNTIKKDRKNHERPLRITSETIRALTRDDLVNVVGGTTMSIYCMTGGATGCCAK